MAKINRIVPSQGGAPLDRAVRLGYGLLLLYFAVFLIGGIVMIWGLATGALSSEDGDLTVLGIISACLCMFAAVFFGMAIGKKWSCRSGRSCK